MKKIEYNRLKRWALDEIKQWQKFIVKLDKQYEKQKTIK